MRNWRGILENESLPEKLRPIKFDAREYYRKLTETELDKKTDRDLNVTLALGLFELKTLIGYDLKIDKHESDGYFWKFVENPLYRMHERTIAENCRESDEYRKKLFEKMDILIKGLSGDKKVIQKP